jgi:hypothetical protein
MITTYKSAILIFATLFLGLKGTCQNNKENTQAPESAKNISEISLIKNELYVQDSILKLQKGEINQLNSDLRDISMTLVRQNKYLEDLNKANLEKIAVLEREISNNENKLKAIIQSHSDADQQLVTAYLNYERKGDTQFMQTLGLIAPERVIEFTDLSQRVAQLESDFKELKNQEDLNAFTTRMYDLNAQTEAYDILHKRVKYLVFMATSFCERSNELFLVIESSKAISESNTRENFLRTRSYQFEDYPSLFGFIQDHIRDKNTPNLKICTD